MTECERLSGRMPAVVLDAAEWTAMELQHLAECDRCQSEWTLVRAANGLGRDVEASIDTEAIALSVLRRLHANRQVEQLRRKWTLGGLAAAAAVMLAVWFGGMDTRDRPAPVSNRAAIVQTAIELPELDSLAPAELDSVLQRMDDPAVAGPGDDEVDLGDLNADELQRVLDTWEG
jgi:anti-sigma factor RsiW